VAVSETYEERCRRSAESQRRNPGKGTCYRCGLTWGDAKDHTTPYHRCGDSLANDPVGCAGCFPLCEPCWRELATPEARLPFYERLVWDWKYKHGDTRDPWPQIRESVMAGN
jgi:hypothetical protein